MKVCFAGYQAISILHGGPNTQLRNTAKQLAALGIECSLFDPWSPFRKESYDLVHLFAANIGTYHLARELKTLGVPMAVSPIIFSLHSHGFIRTSLALTRLAQKFARGVWSDYSLCADICTWANGLLPNTKAEADLVVRGLGVSGSPVRVIPNGVDERFACGDPALFRKTYALENFILTVGHTGHVRKNVLNLIRALGPIDTPAVIVGRIMDNAYGAACREEAAKHRHVLLLDRIDNDSAMLASAYAACDVFALPSLFETPGIAALEAGLAGAKIVITEFGGTREYFGNMATYVDPRSVRSIRAGILAALDRKKDDLLSKHIRERFTWQKVAAETAEAYQGILKGKL